MCKGKCVSLWEWESECEGGYECVSVSMSVGYECEHCEHMNVQVCVCGSVTVRVCE